MTYLSALFYRKNDYKLKNVRFHTPNMHGNLLRTEQAFVKGTCCWKIYPRKGGIGQKLRPGMHQKMPTLLESRQPDVELFF